MRRTGTSQFTPRLRDSDVGMPERPWIVDFTPGYMNRMMPMLPRQGDRAPWTNPQRYKADQRALLADPVDDGVLQFTSHPARTSVSAHST
jgi:monooxygenase